MPRAPGRSTRATRLVALVFLSLACVLCSPLRAGEATIDRAALIGSLEPHLSALGRDPAVIDAVLRQNQQNLTLTAKEIADLRDRWQAERAAGEGPLSRAGASNPASAILRAAAEKAAHDALGPFVGSFLLTDNRDLPAAWSDPPPRYGSPVPDLWRRLFLGRAQDAGLFFPEGGEWPPVIAAVPVRGPDGLVIGSLTVGLRLPAATAEKLRLPPHKEGYELQMGRPEELIDGAE